MTDTVHITKSAGLAGANVSAISIEDLAALIGGDAPTVDPLTPGALWNDSGTMKVSLTPLAITLLTSDEYKISGVDKEFADCYAVNTSSLGDGASGGLITGEGFVLGYFGGGTATGGSASLIATAGLEAAINPTLGVTGVIDVTPVFSSSTEEVFIGPYISVGGGNTIGFDLRPNSIAGTGMQIVIRDASSGSPIYTAVAANVVSGRAYRMAFTLQPDLMMLSVNGGDAVSRTPSVTMDFTSSFLKLYVAVSSANPGSKAIIGDVKYYPVVTDAADLKRLSV